VWETQTPPFAGKWATHQTRSDRERQAPLLGCIGWVDTWEAVVLTHKNRTGKHAISVGLSEVVSLHQWAWGRSPHMLILVSN